MKQLTLNTHLFVQEGKAMIKTQGFANVETKDSTQKWIVKSEAGEQEIDSGNIYLPIASFNLHGNAKEIMLAAKKNLAHILALSSFEEKASLEEINSLMKELMKI